MLSRTRGYEIAELTDAREAATASFGIAGSSGPPA